MCSTYTKVIPIFQTLAKDDEQLDDGQSSLSSQPERTSDGQLIGNGRQSRPRKRNPLDDLLVLAEKQLKSDYNHDNESVFGDYVASNLRMIQDSNNVFFLRN